MNAIKENIIFILACVAVISIVTNTVVTVATAIRIEKPHVQSIQGCQYIVSKNQDGFINYTHLANCTNGIHPHNR